MPSFAAIWPIACAMSSFSTRSWWFSFLRSSTSFLIFSISFWAALTRSLTCVSLARSSGSSVKSCRVSSIHFVTRSRASAAIVASMSMVPIFPWKETSTEVPFLATLVQRRSRDRGSGPSLRSPRRRRLRRASRRRAARARGRVGRTRARASAPSARLGERQQLLDELAGRRRVPVARAHDATEQAPLAVDEIRGRWSEDAVGLPGHVAALVKEHRRGVPALRDRALHEGRAFTEADQPHLEPLRLELAVDLVDGR